MSGNDEQELRESRIRPLRKERAISIGLPGMASANGLVEAAILRPPTTVQVQFLAKCHLASEAWYSIRAFVEKIIARVSLYLTRFKIRLRGLMFTNWI